MMELYWKTDKLSINIIFIVKKIITFLKSEILIFLSPFAVEKLQV